MNSIASMGHRALRKGRISLQGQVYLLTTVTATRAPLFSEFELAATACRVMHARGRAGTNDLELLCWVSMPDHLHALARLRNGRLSSAVGDLKARIAHAVNCHRKLGVPVWQRGFHDRAVRREDDLLTIARYIVANPVRAGLVDSARLYPFWNAAWL